MRLNEAMSHCKVRGYIARESKPAVKHWKNSRHFELLPAILEQEDRDAADWKTYDPEADENPLLG